MNQYQQACLLEAARWTRIATTHYERRQSVRTGNAIGPDLMPKPRCQHRARARYALRVARRWVEKAAA